MRKRNYLVVALALAGAVAVGVISEIAQQSEPAEAGSGGKNVPHVSADVDKTKAPKKKFKKNGITFGTHETVPGCPDGPPTPPGCRVDPAKEVNVSFDKNVKFKPKSEPDQCDPREVENQPVPIARQRCGDALVGQGTATAVVGDDAPVDLNADTLVFNGTPVNGKPGIVLYARTKPPIPITTVLPSYIGKTPKGLARRAAKSSPGVSASSLKGGQTLFVTVSRLAGGLGSLTGFSAHVKQGKYVTTRCKGKKKGKWKFSGEFTYDTIPPGGGAAGPPEYGDTATTSQKCKVKKKKK